MNDAALEVRVAAGLRLFLPARHRRERVRVPYDGTSSLGHVVESLGIPLPEVGRMVAGDLPREPAYRPVAGQVVEVAEVPRPERLPAPRFTLDVHLGALARRLRLVGVDTAYANDVDDDTLIQQANRERRVLLTQDRWLLRRRALWRGAYVRGARPAEQLHDVLDRFAPPLAPWTRCTACNGELAAVAKDDVEHLLQPGTRRNYRDFSRCESCGRVYWRGAHSGRLAAIVDAALATVATTGSPG
ncbi:MAG TPA: Mut7-C RNAse domain-containing protein [Amycolatopsis sp.]|uniref:Mut7-C RNAse domain-containing protein n=1 Tax=Amycolatopsis sp. TaxID=37632 RepID=UPI002B471FD0|nr:Mut7-C RNAse domain-containing protein [Amycolatopsis sp.]HKS47059.1 Mut7-C RNAse domain-containing protein [Amycolatopsis sp.]